jgi:hypothetical protein
MTIKLALGGAGPPLPMVVHCVCSEHAVWAFCGVCGGRLYANEPVRCETLESPAVDTQRRHVHPRCQHRIQDWGACACHSKP